MSLLRRGAQRWTHHSRGGLTSAEHKGTLLPYGQLGVHQDLPGSSPQSCFPVGWPPAGPGAWGSPSPAAGLCASPCSGELQEVPAGPFLQPVEVRLDGSTTLWGSSCSSQFGVIWKPAEDGLGPVLQEQMAAWTPVLISMGSCMSNCIFLSNKCYGAANHALPPSSLSERITAL